ncbi:ghrelin O-acyltransferase [Silurus meridionalis]|uniref:ghrelin O-acyltransferase n=1 Tax=Silurus meridionalis TaxID=175797 RepID=UPI001EEA1908|nr:ghrelin O-acyltransferase [Silurus meridionalis]
MHLLWIIFNQNPQLVYQLLTIPLAFMFYSLATKGHLTLFNRHICLAVGGFSLAVLTMGPYSMLLFITNIIFVLLVHFMEPVHIHNWILGLQMCWQTLWHFYMQYQQYWLYENSDSRLVLAMSALMLLSQRVTSVSMDLQEGKVIRCFEKSLQSQVISLIPFLSYTLYFPALLGGPLCAFNTYVSFVEQISVNPPPSPLPILLRKMLQVLFLLIFKFLLTHLLQSTIFSPSSSPCILWIWIFSLVLRLNYYVHWKISECVNNATGLGFSGYSTAGGVLWNGLSDGDAFEIESSSNISTFARLWNKTTATWLRRLVFQRCRRMPVLMTFSFSALWHGLYPGQVAGFLGWGVAVLGDHKLHKYLSPRLTTAWRKGLYTCLSWLYTQVVITCVVIITELQSLEALKLFCTTRIALFPLASIVILLSL